MEPGVSGVVVAAGAASSGSLLWVCVLLALGLGLAAFSVRTTKRARRDAAVRLNTYGHVRRESDRITFTGADVAGIDFSRGHVILDDGGTRDAKLISIVDSAGALTDATTLRISIGRPDGIEEYGSMQARDFGTRSSSSLNEQRVLKFPSRRSLDAFRDALYSAQGIEKASKPDAVTVFLTTWNVGNSQPSSYLSNWFDSAKDADIIAIGTQECLYSVSNAAESSVPSDNIAAITASRTAQVTDETTAPLLSNSDSGMSSADMTEVESLNASNLSGKEHWKAVLRSHFPKSEFDSLVEVVSWDRSLSVFVRKNLASAVSHVRTDTVFVGFGGVAGNKGAIGTRFKVYDTEIAIVNSHLAAHQGEITRRNQDYSSIVSSLRLLRDGADVDILTSSIHHLFWMGDLNYRVDLKLDQVLNAVTERSYNILIEADQLRKAMHSGDAFVGFKEGRIEFQPTYRYERGSTTYSETKMRIPSYCDRILWRSLPGVECNLRSYDSVDSVLTSDHKPVTALFEAKLVHTTGLRKMNEIGSENDYSREENDAQSCATTSTTATTEDIRDKGLSAASVSSRNLTFSASAARRIDEKDRGFVLEFKKLRATGLPSMGTSPQSAMAMMARNMMSSESNKRREEAPSVSGSSITNDDAMTLNGEMSGDSEALEGSSTGNCDAYCVFHGEAVAELERGQYMTKVIPCTQNPVWRCGDIPVVHLEDDVGRLVRKKYLSITVMDEDTGATDNVVGSAVLWLGHGWREGVDDGAGHGGVVASADFQTPILHRGLARGSLSGSYVVRHADVDD